MYDQHQILLDLCQSQITVKCHWGCRESCIKSGLWHLAGLLWCWRLACLMHSLCFCLCDRMAKGVGSQTGWSASHCTDVAPCFCLLCSCREVWAEEVEGGVPQCRQVWRLSQSQTLGKCWFWVLWVIIAQVALSCLVLHHEHTGFPVSILALPWAHLPCCESHAVAFLGAYWPPMSHVPWGHWYSTTYC